MRLVSGLERLADWLMIALFVLIFALVLAQIVCRYVFSAPLVWSEELARLAFIWLAMLGWSLGSRRRSHIAISFFVDLLPTVPRAALGVAVQGSIILLCLLLVHYGWTLTRNNLDLPMVTLHLSYAAVYAVVPVGAVAVILYALAEIRDLVALLRGRRRS